MTTININSGLYKKWVNYYEKKADKLIFPTLKNFTEQQLMRIIKQ